MDQRRGQIIKRMGDSDDQDSRRPFMNPFSDHLTMKQIVSDDASFLYVGALGFWGSAQRSFHTNNEQVQLKQMSHVWSEFLGFKINQNIIQAHVPFHMMFHYLKNKTNIGRLRYYCKLPKQNSIKSSNQQQETLEKEQKKIMQEIKSANKKIKKQLNARLIQLSRKKASNKKLAKRFFPIRCQVYMSKSIFNQKSDSYSKNLKKLDNIQSLLNTLKASSQQYRDLRQQMERLISEQLFPQKIARTLLLYLMEKAHVKVVNRSFVKPPPKLNFLMRQYRRLTIGLITKNKRNQRKLQRKVQMWKHKFQGFNLMHFCVGPRNQKAYLSKYYSAVPKQILIWKNPLSTNYSQHMIFYHKLYLQMSCRTIQVTRSIRDFVNQNRKNVMDEIGAYGFDSSQEGGESQSDQQQNQASQKQMDIDQFKLMKRNEALMQKFETQSKFFKRHQTPSLMISQLKPYQGQALQWMKYREGKIPVQQLFEQGYKDDTQGFQFQRKLSPFWQQIQLIGGQKFYTNYLTGQFTLQFHDWKSIKGGILADQMGLGKTVMTLALLADQNWEGLNLIVVPVAVLLQWKDQIVKHCGDEIEVYQFHSDSKNRRKTDLYDYKIILITYATLGNQYKYYSSNGNVSKQGQKSLFDYNFQRVVLDEAHNIRGTNTLQFNAVMNLKSKYSWCLTGTLIQNSEQDLFAIFKFLRVQVFSQEPWWNQYIKNAGCTQAKMNVIQTVLRPIVLRRTKASTSNQGQSIITLTKKYQHVIRPQFTKQQASIYEKLQKGVRNYFRTSSQAGKNYTHIFQIISKLRQFCCHPALIFGQDVQNIQQKDIQGILNNFLGRVPGKQFKQNAVKTIMSGEECIICLTEPDDQNAVLTTCGHYFCQSCLKKTMSINPHCPVCRSLLSPMSYIKKSDIVVPNQLTDLNQSSKMTSIFQILQKINKRKQKCVIFTQWIKIISLMQEKLSERQIQFATIMGNMAPEKRQRAIKKFRDKQSCRFLIVSIRAGSTGLNLAFANNVIICDPWWNPANQDQAIGRVHRLGQTKQVNVYRFIMKNSIQEKIQKMHVSKRQLANQVMMQKGSLQNAKTSAAEELMRLLQD